MRIRTAWLYMEIMDIIGSCCFMRWILDMSTSCIRKAKLQMICFRIFIVMDQKNRFASSSFTRSAFGM